MASNYHTIIAVTKESTHRPFFFSLPACKKYSTTIKTVVEKVWDYFMHKKAILLMFVNKQTHSFGTLKAIIFSCTETFHSGHDQRGTW